MEQFGIQLFLELKVCDKDLLDNFDNVKNSMISAAEVSGQKVLAESFYKFSPLGVTGIVSVAKSHLSIHTWPELGYAAADIFTAGKSFSPKDAANILINSLNCNDPSITEIKRGELFKNE